VTALHAAIVETVDRLDGTRVQDAVLKVRHISRLTCGCTRFSCDRPGGGQVDVIRGEHCEQLARPSPVPVPESIPA
jgi:hypothetical protein